MATTCTPVSGDYGVYTITAKATYNGRYSNSQVGFALTVYEIEPVTNYGGLTYTVNDPAETFTIDSPTVYQRTTEAVSCSLDSTHGFLTVTDNGFGANPMFEFSVSSSSNADAGTHTIKIGCTITSPSGDLTKDDVEEFDITINPYITISAPASPAH